MAAKKTAKKRTTKKKVIIRDLEWTDVKKDMPKETDMYFVIMRPPVFSVDDVPVPVREICAYDAKTRTWLTGDSRFDVLYWCKTPAMPEGISEWWMPETQ